MSKKVKLKEKEKEEDEDGVRREGGGRGGG